jgi:hypothetical protein
MNQPILKNSVSRRLMKIMLLSKGVKRGYSRRIIGNARTEVQIVKRVVSSAWGRIKEGSGRNLAAERLEVTELALDLKEK